MSHTLTAAELEQLLSSLVGPTAFIELVVFAGCLVLAWLAVYLLDRATGHPPRTILFGRYLFDGVLFPVAALLLALLARRVLLAEIQPAVFRLVLPILTSLVAIRSTVRVLRAAFPSSTAMRVVERSLSWLAWIAVVLWVTGILPFVLEELDRIQWKVGSAEISVRNLIEGSLSAIVVLMISLWVSSALEAQLLRGATDNLSVRKMAANFLRALLLFIGLIFALSAAGIDLTALGVLGGALGVGIGFGLQKLASNYVSGFVILAERSVRIGDMVRVDGFEGRITDITTRYTVVRALNGRESIVPNDMLITQRVENLSLTDPTISLSTVVQVAYGTDLERVRPKLEEALRGVPRVLSEPAPNVQLSAFADSGLELTINFWIGDPGNGMGNVRSDVNLAVLQVLTSAGVDIPFPQRVVRFVRTG